MAARQDRVIIVGGGPVGMVLALALHKSGIPVTILEKESEPLEDQRAATLHLTSVEMLDNLGLFAEFRDLGVEAPLYHFRDRPTGDLVAEFDFSLLKDEVPFPFAFQYEQFKLVDSIIAHLGDTPDVAYRYSCEVGDIEQSADSVAVGFTNEAGARETMTGAYVVGCDGARSVVRDIAGIAFEGFTWPDRFVKIGTNFDFFSAGRGYCTRNFLSDPDEWCNLFRVEGHAPPGIWRTVFPIPPGESDEQAMSAEGLQGRLQRFFPREGDYQIAYSGLYTVHQRVAASFTEGRILLAGDSGHVNNPIGGLGMNGGIHDAVNLADKLDRVMNQGGDTELLALYSRQRRKAQIDGLQVQSIANKKTMEARDPAVRKEQLDNLRRTVADDDSHRAYVRRSSLIDSLNTANAVQ